MVQGAIEVDDTHVVLDGVSYPIKSQRKNGMFKSRKCSFQFIYNEGKLSIIKVYRYDSVTSYYIR